MSETLTLTAADGFRLSAYRARPAGPPGEGSWSCRRSSG